MTRNSEVLKCGRSLEKFTEMVRKLKAILERFIESLSCMDQCFIAGMDVESLPNHSVVGSTRVPQPLAPVESPSFLMARCRLNTEQE